MARLKLNLPQTLSGTFKPPASWGTPGYTPDYTKLILGDPTYRQTAADVSAQNVAAGAERDQGLQSRLVDFGTTPDLNSAANSLGLSPDSPLFKALQGAINPQITAAAQGNPFSTVANNQYGHEKALGAILDNFGSSGFQQGAYASAAAGENRRYGQQQYDAHQQLLSYLAGIQHTFAQQQQQGANTLTGAAQDATTRQAQLNPVVPGSGLLGGLTPQRIAPSLNLPRRPTGQASAFQMPGYTAHGGAA